MSALLAEANAYVANDISVSATDFPKDFDLTSDQRVDWVSSTFDGHHLINIFAVTEQRSIIGFLALRHGDYGIVEQVDGPFGGLDEAEAYFDIGGSWTRV
jgi:hypothetical protein